MMGVINKLTNGLSWHATALIISRLFSLVAQVVVGKVLSRGDFAVYAYVMAIISVMNPLTEGGIQRVLVPVRALNANHVEIVNRVSWKVSFYVIAIGVCISAWLYQSKDASYALTLVGLLLVVPLSVTGNLYRVQITRSHNFRVVGLSSVVLGGSRSVLLMFCVVMGFGLYSFVAATLGGKLIELVYLSRNRVMIEGDQDVDEGDVVDADALHSAMLWVGIGAFLTASVNNLDYLVVGAFGLGAILAPYFFGFQFCAAFSTLLTSGVMHVFTPVLSSLAPTERLKMLIGGLNAVAAISAPLFLVSALVMESLFGFLWGSKWLDASIVASLMLVALSVRITTPLVRSYFESGGGWRLQAKLLGADSIGTALAATVGVMVDSESVWGVSIAVCGYRIFYGGILLFWLGKKNKCVCSLQSLLLIYFIALFSLVLAVFVRLCSDSTILGCIVFIALYFFCAWLLVDLRRIYASLILRILSKSTEIGGRDR